MEKVFPNLISIFNLTIDIVVEFEKMYYLHLTHEEYDKIFKKLEPEFFRCFLINKDGETIKEDRNILKNFIDKTLKKQNEGCYILLIEFRFPLEGMTNCVLKKNRDWNYDVVKEELSTNKLPKKTALLIQL